MIASIKISVALDYAESFLGLPYRWGGDDPVLGVDCSGYVSEILRATGDLKPWERLSSAQLFERFREFQSLTPPLAGDLLFFGDPISHVAIARNAEFMYESGGGRNTTDTPEEAAKENAFVRIRPISNRPLVAVVRLWR